MDDNETKNESEKLNLIDKTIGEDFQIHKKMERYDEGKSNFFDCNDNQEKFITNEDSQKLHLSLIIDDDNKLTLDFYPTDNIQDICNEICQKNKLDVLVAKKLTKKIEEQINLMINDKNHCAKVKEEEIVNRLYTEAVKRKIIKDQYFEKKKNDLKERELNNYSFTPKISEKSNFIYNRSHLKIEDKLFYEEIMKKEKRNFLRIIKDINNKEMMESKIIGGNNKKSEYQKKGKSNNKLRDIIKNREDLTKPEGLKQKNFTQAVDQIQNGHIKDNYFLNSSNCYMKNSPKIDIVRKVIIPILTKEKNDQNSEYSTNLNILNNMNANNTNNKYIKINQNNNNSTFNNNEMNTKNGLLNEETKIKYTTRKSFKESPQIISKKKTQVNLSDKEENFNNIINFTNQDNKRLSFGQINHNQFTNLTYKHNHGNTYSSIHKNNTSTTSAKNQFDTKKQNSNNKNRNSFSNRKNTTLNNYIGNEISENISEIQRGSVEKIDNVFHLKLSRSPYLNDNTNTKEYLNQDLTKKESIFGCDSIISNEDYKIIKMYNGNKNNEKNGTAISNNSIGESENFIKKNIQVDKNNYNTEIELEKLDNNHFKKQNYLIKSTDSKTKYSKTNPVKKKYIKGDHLENEYSKVFKSFKEDSRKKYYKDSFDRLYRDAQETKKNKEKYYEFITKRECPFKPQISDKSRTIIKTTFRSEEKEEIYKRLSRNKTKEHELKKSKSKLSLSAYSNINSIKDKKNQSSEAKNSLKNSKSSKLYYTDSEGNRRVRTKITIREQKSENEIYSTIDDLNHQSNQLKRSINKKIKENMGKFKLNNLKEVFEVIFSKCNSVQDIQNLAKYGISDRMKDNIILPSLHVLQERNLEFNFQNFYLIANEIINMAI